MDYMKNKIFKLLGAISTIGGYLGMVYVTWYIMIIRPIMHFIACYQMSTLDGMVLAGTLLSIFCSGVPGMFILILSSNITRWCYKKAGEL